MSPLELKKVKAELLRVQSAKAELDYRIEVAMEEIARMQESIKVSSAKETELLQRIEELNKASQ